MTRRKPRPTPTHAIPFDPDALHALDAVMDELMALDADTLLPLNVDITPAATVVLGAAPEIREHRAALVALVGEPMVRPIDRLELVARATLQAHGRHRAIESGAELAPLLARVTEHRDLLRAEVRLLVARKLMPARVADELTHARGYKNVSLDVFQLVAAFRENWDAVDDKTGVTLRDLGEADAAATYLVSAVGLRDKGPRSPSANVRQRAYTLMAQTYDQARRLITFLRWTYGDADRIAPSFYQGQGWAAGDGKGGKGGNGDDRARGDGGTHGDGARGRARDARRVAVRRG